MFDGKMLRGLTGMPMRRKLLAKSSFADAEPEPLTLANLMTKSLRASILFMFSSGLQRKGLLRTTGRPCVGHLDQRLLHVPGTGRTALGAQAAVQADVLVLDHDAAGLEVVGDVEVLREVHRRRLELPAQIRLFGVGRKDDAVHRADVDAGVALDAERAGEDGLHVAIETALRFGQRELGI